jgi:hypothetical protein
MEAGGRLVKKLLNADVQKEAAKLEAKLEAEAKEKIQVSDAYNVHDSIPAGISGIERS